MAFLRYWRSTTFWVEKRGFERFYIVGFHWIRYLSWAASNRTILELKHVADIQGTADQVPAIAPFWN